MTQINDTQYASISELKRDPRGLVQKANNAPILILNHNSPAMVLMSTQCYEELRSGVGKLDQVA